MKAELKCSGIVSANPGFGGWGAVFEYEDGTKRLASGSEPNITRAQMEFFGVLKALQELQEPCEVLIRTDSQIAFMYLTTEAAARDNDLTNIRNEIRDLAKEKGHEITVLRVDRSKVAEARKLAKVALDNCLASAQPMFNSARNSVYELGQKRYRELARSMGLRQY